MFASCVIASLLSIRVSVGMGLDTSFDAASHLFWYVWFLFCFRAKEILFTKASLNNFMADYCDQPVEKIAADVRTFFRLFVSWKQKVITSISHLI